MSRIDFQSFTSFDDKSLTISKKSMFDDQFEMLFIDRCSNKSDLMNVSMDIRLKCIDLTMKNGI